MKKLLRASCSLLVLCSLGCESPKDEPKTDPAPDAVELVVYSGRSESLVQPLFDRFQTETGVVLKVRYGDTAALAALLLEEGEKSPAGLFFAQDAGALGAVVKQLEMLPVDVTERVPAAYRATGGEWVGITGRARTVVYNTDKVKTEELPNSVFDLADPKWKGRIGWAPTNGSFQAFVTAMRMMTGEAATKKWLEDIRANEPREYPKNSAIVQATGAGEIDVGLVNHYYLYRFTKENAEFPAKNHYLQPSDPGSLVNVAGVGVLKQSKAEQKDAAMKLVRFLLSPDAQLSFATESYEYPVLAGIRGPEGLRPLTELSPPDLDLNKLEDLEGTLRLLRETKAIP